MSANEVYILFAGPFGYDDGEKVQGVYHSLEAAQQARDPSGIQMLSGVEWAEFSEGGEWYVLDPTRPEKEQMLPYRIQRYKVQK